MKHLIADTGERFVISPNSKGIVRPSGQVLNLVQFDHNSERITFEIPRYVDSHDMSKCNRVEVHYLNTDIDTQITNEGLYEVDDLQIDIDDDTKVVCTWLISQNATQLKGALSFLLSFKCVQDNGTIDYVWNTAVYTDASVVGGINVSDVVVDQYADVLQQWYVKLFEMEGGNIDQHTGEPVLFATVTQAVYDAMTPEERVPDCHYLIEDDDTFEQFDSRINTALQQMNEATDAMNEATAEVDDKVNAAVETIETTDTELRGFVEDKMSETVPIIRGGTGATSLADALANLGLTLAAKIKTGTYTGDGKRKGVTLSFEEGAPLVVILVENDHFAIFVRGCPSAVCFEVTAALDNTIMEYYNTCDTYNKALWRVKATWVADTLSWSYHADDGSSFIFNTKGVTYDYIAWIG